MTARHCPARPWRCRRRGRSVRSGPDDRRARGRLAAEAGGLDAALGRLVVIVADTVTWASRSRFQGVRERRLPLGLLRRLSRRDRSLVHDAPVREPRQAGGLAQPPILRLTGALVAIDEMVEQARSTFDRVTARQAWAELHAGAILVDIRPEFQRRADGDPGQWSSSASTSTRTK